jgi:hypothetical protein
MAKEILTQWNAPARAFDKMKPFQGLVKPGVYRGYDELVADGGPDTEAEFIPVKVLHNETAFTKIKSDETAEALPHGLLVFPNGLMVHDSDEIDGIEIDFTGSGVTAIYVLIAQLDFVEVQDGATVSYFASLDAFTGGTVENPSITLPSPNKQVAVGLIVAHPNAESISGLSYHRLPTPPLADADIMRYPGVGLLATKEEAKMKADFTQSVLSTDLGEYILRMTAIMIGSLRFITIHVTMNSSLSEVQLSAPIPSSHRPTGGKLLNYINHTNFGGSGNSKLEVYMNGNVIFSNDHTQAVEMSVTYIRTS